MSNHMKSPAIKDLHFSWYLKILSNYTRLKARANVSHSVYQFLKIDFITRDPPHYSVKNDSPLEGLYERFVFKTRKLGQKKELLVI